MPTPPSLRIELPRTLAPTPDAGLPLLPVLAMVALAAVLTWGDRRDPKLADAALDAASWRR